jgi:hypothetical protein
VRQFRSAVRDAHVDEIAAVAIVNKEWNPELR